MADHVLLQNGKVLFNVRIEDTIATSARPLRVFHQDGLLYDYDTREIKALGIMNKISDVYSVADYVTTRGKVARKDMRGIMESLHWTHYVPPPQKGFSWAPPATPTPTPKPHSSEPPPANVASDALPLEKRLDVQMKMFQEEQIKLMRDIRARAQVGRVNKEQGIKERVDLLESEIKLIQKFYEKNELTDKAIEQIKNQQKQVKQRGEYVFEEYTL